MPTVLPGGVLAANPTCQNVGIGNGPAKVTFVNAGVPRARWSTRDGLSNDSIYGLWYKINDGSGPVDIVDNQALDLDSDPACTK